MYGILDKVFRIIRDYPTTGFSLPKVTDIAMRRMRDYGYQVELIDGKHRDYRIIRVDNHLYRIFREKGWLRYDVAIVE